MPNRPVDLFSIRFQIAHRTIYVVGSSVSGVTSLDNRGAIPSCISLIASRRLSDRHVLGYTRARGRCISLIASRRLRAIRAFSLVVVQGGLRNVGINIAIRILTCGFVGGVLSAIGAIRIAISISRIYRPQNRRRPRDRFGGGVFVGGAICLGCIPWTFGPRGAGFITRTSFARRC